MVYSRLARQNSLPSVYPGANEKRAATGGGKGIPMGSAPPPLNYNASQGFQQQQDLNTPRVASSSSSSSPAPMIRSKTSYGIGNNQHTGNVLSAPSSPMTGTSKGTKLIARSPSSAKEMMLIWVQQRVNTYPGMNVTNFSSCWNDGLAFCAIIHFYYPDAFDFESLESKNRRYNFTLAFDMAEKLADICPLLEVDDMVRFQKPDWKCVFTYVQSFYRRFRNVPLQQKVDSTADNKVNSSKHELSAANSQLVSRN